MSRKVGYDRTVTSRIELTLFMHRFINSNGGKITKSTWMYCCVGFCVAFSVTFEFQTGDCARLKRVEA